MRLTGWTTAAALAAILLTPRTGPAAAADYPPSGSPDPGAPCAREEVTPSTKFFCDFMTLERWLAAGRPDFVDANGKRWQPWFYGKDGLTNQMLIEGKTYRPAREGWLEGLFEVEAFEAENYSYFWDLFRYTPWSVQFQHAYKCGERQMVNPAALRGRRIRQEHLLTFGWEGADGDASDPTAAFDRDAMRVLETLAHLELVVGSLRRERLNAGHTVRDEINDMAEGRGAFWPDYDRDAEVWLVQTEDAPVHLRDLDRAAMRLAEIGLVVTNDAISTWEDGRAAAVQIARERGPLLYIYFAQDAFPSGQGHPVYRERLRYLIENAAALAREQGSDLTIISRGRSAGIVSDAVAARKAVHHETLPSLPGLDQSAERARVEVSEGGVGARSGTGAVVSKPAACLGP